MAVAVLANDLKLAVGAVTSQSAGYVDTWSGVTVSKGDLAGLVAAMAAANNGALFPLILPDTNGDIDGGEIVYVTAISGSGPYTLTVARGAEPLSPGGTPSAPAHSAGTWELVATADMLGSAAWYGAGDLGNVTISGSTSLTAAPNYKNLHITSTGVLTPQSFTILVAGTLTIDAGGQINNNGHDAVGATAGISKNVGGNNYGYGGAGGNGGTGNGAAGVATSGGTYANGGGAGGAGGTGAGGAGPSSYGGYASADIPTNLFWAGNGGGGGGGDGTNSGGGGGGGASPVFIFAQNVINNGAISASGGAGAAGVAGNAGGGGGGGAAFIRIICGTYAGSGTVTANGGAGGAGVGTGVAGSNGLLQPAAAPIIITGA